MEFWDQCKEFVGNVATTIKDTAVRTYNSIAGAVKNLFTPKRSEVVDKGPIYDPDAGTNYTQSIDDSIYVFLEANLPDADVLESDVLAVCQSAFADHVATINKYINERGLDIDTREFDRASLTLEKKFRGRLKQHLQSNFSLSNQACLAAFSSSDTSRRLKCWNSVVDSGLSQLNEKVTEYFKDQNALIQDTIRARVEEQREIVASEKAQLAQLLQMKDSDMAQQEIAKMRVLFSVDCCDIGLQYIDKRAESNAGHGMMGRN